jgi:hypothetical protein
MYMISIPLNIMSSFFCLDSQILDKVGKIEIGRTFDLSVLGPDRKVSNFKQVIK